MQLRDGAVESSGLLMRSRVHRGQQGVTRALFGSHLGLADRLVTTSGRLAGDGVTPTVLGSVAPSTTELACSASPVASGLQLRLTLALTLLMRLLWLGPTTVVTPGLAPSLTTSKASVAAAPAPPTVPGGVGGDIRRVELGIRRRRALASKMSPASTEGTVDA